MFGFLKMGTGGLVAQAHGSATAHNEQSLNGGNDIDSAMLRALLIGLLLGLVIVLLRKPIIAFALSVFSASDELKQLVLDYCHIRILAAPATLMVYGILGTFIGLQKMRSVLTLQLVLNLSNVILTVGFFHYFDWGINCLLYTSPSPRDS